MFAQYYKRLFEQNAHVLEPHIDLEQVRGVTLLSELDELVCPRLYGFKSRKDFYEHCNDAARVGASLPLPLC
jgi:predicted alpha/beta-fold hydrolase